MTLVVDPGLRLSFGSEDRVRTLAALANASAPLTVYRVATIVGIKPPNVYRELKRLLQFNEVQRASTPENRDGWVVVDPDLKALMRRRLRIVWSQDLTGSARERERRAALAMQRSARDPLDLSKFKACASPRSMRFDGETRRMRLSRRLGPGLPSEQIELLDECERVSSNPCESQVSPRTESLAWRFIGDCRKDPSRNRGRLGYRDLHERRVCIGRCGRGRESQGPCWNVGKVGLPAEGTGLVPANLICGLIRLECTTPAMKIVCGKFHTLRPSQTRRG